MLGLFGLVWKQNACSASKSILVLGNSLSVEYGVARGSGWVAFLQQRLQQEKFDVNIVNTRISGETKSRGKSWLPALLQQPPDVIIIELGANNALHDLQLQATCAAGSTPPTIPRKKCC